MKQITVKEMAAALNKAVKEGNGDKYLITANDNEGNGYHGIFFTVSPVTADFGWINDTCEENTDNLMCIG